MSSHSIYNRISGRLGQLIGLDATFYRDGIPIYPYALRMVKIYKQSVDSSNLVAQIPFPYPDSSDYPEPAIIDPHKPGFFKVLFDVPSDLPVPNIYFDVWYFVPDSLGSDHDLDDESKWLNQCNRFWLYPDGWYLNDGLITPRLAFEPLDVKFRSGESRYLEVGMMPLPLYDYEYNLIVPMLPYIQATIKVMTRNCEVLVDGDEMLIGLRQGSYRSNPFVVKYLLDTTKFLIGTYNYRVKLQMPSGETIISPDFTFTIA